MLQAIITISLFCTGVNMVFRDGFLLGCIGNILRSMLPHWVSSPLFDCLVCMGGFWGATGLIFITNDYTNLLYFPCVIGCNAILNGLINKTYDQF
jgi:hypothetical protein